MNFCAVHYTHSLSLVQDEVEMSLQDRVAFACTYLEDAVLYSFIGRLTREVTESGQINGLFLTGLTDEGITLLTNYVNEVSVYYTRHHLSLSLSLFLSDW